MHSKLGLDRCTHGLYSGAAPLSHDTMAFMKSLGLVISEVACFAQYSCRLPLFIFFFWNCFLSENTRMLCTTVEIFRFMGWRKTRTTMQTTLTRHKATEGGFFFIILLRILLTSRSSYEWQHSCRSSYSWSCQGSESDPPSAGSSKAALDDRPLVVKQSCIFKILPMV